MVRRVRVSIVAFGASFAFLALAGCGTREVAKFTPNPPGTKEEVKQRKADAQGNYAKMAKEAYLKAQKR